MSKEINLTILNKLVEALNAQVKVIDELPKTTPREDVIVELSKAMGISSSISFEGSGLASDTTMLIKKNTVSSDDIGDIFGAFNTKDVGKN